jgi:hypothetical protein
MTATKLRRHISIKHYRNLFYKQFKSLGLWVDLHALDMSREVRTGLHVECPVCLSLSKIEIPPKFLVAFLSITFHEGLFTGSQVVMSVSTT